jgi:hypothetical protein
MIRLSQPADKEKETKNEFQFLNDTIKPREIMAKNGLLQTQIKGFRKY